MFDSLPFQPRINRKDIPFLQAANGNSLTSIGSVELTFRISGLDMTQKFYVTDGLNRNMILGRDWMTRYSVRLYFDLGLMRINGKTYTELKEDIHISSIVRTTKKLTIKPNTVTVCRGKVNNNFPIEQIDFVEVHNIDNECLLDDPGVYIKDSVCAVRQSRNIPIIIVNQSNRHYKIPRGHIVGRVTPTETTEICEIQNDTSEDEKINVPRKFETSIKSIIRRNKDLFAKKDSDLGLTNTVKMSIDTGDHDPIKNRPYRVPLNKRQIIDKAVKEMLDAKIIDRSQSPWSFPLVVVKKKDGSDRMCVDFRTLNKIVKPVSFPLPLIDDILCLLGKARYFTALDLKSGYWQVQLDEKSKEKTAFACHKGLFQFNRMPFGLSNAPAVFQELMNIVLQGKEDFSIAYLDDILIFSETAEKHLEHIQEVFDRLRKHGLKLKLKKCSFFQEQTEYLGFIINEKGVKPDPKKVAAIRQLPAPTSVREIRGFIGMCSYYRRFIPNFSQIAEPLIDLTRKYAKFRWSETCQRAFDYLKKSLTVVPLLTYPDINKPYVLYTDASDECVGACLTQQTDEGEEKPIYYLSHKLSKTQKKWPTIEKEAYAIHYALQKLDHYLHNAEFVIRTDHKPLKYILDSPMQNKKIQLWALSIAGYNCKVEYIEGRYNCCADLLSRLPTSIKENEPEEESNDDEPDCKDNFFEVNVLNSNAFALSPKKLAGCQVKQKDELIKPFLDLPKEINIQEAQKNDVQIRKLRNKLTKGTATVTEEKKFLEIEGLMYYLSDGDSESPRLRLYVPRELESLVVQQYHDGLGHMGVDKTYDAIRSKYYMPNLYKRLHTYVEGCVVCQTRSGKKTQPPLQETDIPPFPFAKVGLDLSGPYPTTLSGNKYIISFIDIYSGWPEAFPVPDKSADNIVHLILEEIYPRFGCPLQILTDNGTENVNKAVDETLKELNIDHITTSYYSPQGNGKVERFHRTLHDVMAKKIVNDAQTWDIYLNQTLAAIRFHPNESSKFSPYYLLYNRDVVLPLDTLLKPRRRYNGEEQHKIILQEQHKAFLLVHRNMKISKRKQKEQADKKSEDIPLQVGDPVYLKNNRRKNKLDKKWLPYYRIIKQTGPVSFVVKDQLTGTTTKCHARQLRLADLAQWPSHISNESDRPMRKTNYVVPPTDEESSEEEEILEPLGREIRHKQKEREDSDDEEDIPLAELQRRLRAKKIMDQKPTKTNSDSDETDVDYESDSERREFLVADEQSPKQEPLDEDMEIDAVASVGRGFSKKDTPIPLPRLPRKQPIPVPRKTKLKEREKMVELFTSMTKLLL